VSCISIAQACKYRIKHNEMGLGLSGNSAVFGAGSGPATSYSEVQILPSQIFPDDGQVLD